MRILSGLFFHSCKQGEEPKTTEKLKKEPIENQKGGAKETRLPTQRLRRNLQHRKRKEKTTKFFFSSPMLPPTKHTNTPKHGEKKKIYLANLYYGFFFPFPFWLVLKWLCKRTLPFSSSLGEEINFFPQWSNRKRSQTPNLKVFSQNRLVVPVCCLLCPVLLWGKIFHKATKHNQTQQKAKFVVCCLLFV